MWMNAEPRVYFGRSEPVCRVNAIGHAKIPGVCAKISAIPATEGYEIIWKDSNYDC